MRKGHHVSGRHLPERRVHALAHIRSRSAKLFTAVSLDAAGQLADHDLAGFDRKRHFAAGQNARSDADVLGNGDLTLFSDMHRCFSRLSAIKYELEVGIIQCRICALFHGRSKVPRRS